MQQFLKNFSRLAVVTFLCCLMATQNSSGQTDQGFVYSVPDSLVTPLASDTVIQQKANSKFVAPAKAEEQKAVQTDSLINFPINTSITYLKLSHFQTNEGREAFVESTQAERKLQQVLEQSNRLRAKYDQTDESGKATLAESILGLEKTSYELNKLIAQKKQLANTLEANYWESAGDSAIYQFAEILRTLSDSIAEASMQKQETAIEEQAIIIIETSDSLAMDSLKTSIEPPVNEIIYKIQIGAYRNTPPDWVQQLFKKLSVLRRIDQYTDEKGVTVYTVGELKTYKDALQMLKQIKLEGVNNAIIAAYRNGERVKINDARKTEN